MPTSRRQTLIDAVVTRLRSILTAGGYETNLGQQIHVWRDTTAAPWTAAELANGALNLRDPKQASTQELVNKHHHILDLVCEIAVASGLEANVIRKMIADVFKAIGVDRKWSGAAFDTLPGDDQILVAQNGTAITGALVNFTIHYRTASFDPYTA